jgi:Phosphotransferase enzyme family
VTGLSVYSRDLELPARAGQPELSVPRAESLLAEFGERLGLAATSAELVYARWKPGVGITAAYSIPGGRASSGGQASDPGPNWIVYRRHVLGKWQPTEALASARRKLGARSDDELSAQDQALPLVSDPARGQVVFAYPADPDLPGAPRALDIGRFARWFEPQGRLAGWRVRRKHFQGQCLRYRPGSRAVYRLEVKREGPQGEKERELLGLRVLPPERAAQVVSARQTAENLGAALLLPALVAFEARTGLIYEQWLPVNSQRADDYSQTTLAGELLGQLHRLPLPQGAAARELVPASLNPTEDWAEFGPRFPLLRRSVEQVTAPLLEHLEPAWSHGDFHPDNVGLGQTGPRFLDVDQLALRDVRADLAAWLAGALELGVRRGQPSDWMGLYAELIATYGRAPAPSSLRPWLVAELLRRAVACLRRLELGAESLALQMIALARAVQAERLP